MNQKVLLFVGLLAVAGCGAVPEDEPAIAISESTAHFTVEGAAGTITDAQSRALQGFIRRIAAGRPENVHLVLRAVSSDRLVPAINRLAVAAGVQPSKIEFDQLSPDTVAKGNESVEVVAQTAVASVPDCPRLSHISDTMDYRNTISSNFGCAYQSNYAAMVSDKRDLAIGESGGLTDGLLTSAAIDRLHDDKVKKIDETGSRGGQ
jgi:pilus assembly protein CpaD